jgi:hypothetical protein
MSTGLAIFTLVHVAISLVGIFSGFVVLFGLLNAKRMEGWTAIFLATTVLTGVTGFLFPFKGFTPALGTGIVSMVVLAIALYARYARRLVGGWRKTYVISAVFALYLNVFVLVVQTFLKVPALNALAPKQNEPPFAITQLLVLVTFIVLGVLATIRFRLEPVRAA